LLPCLPYFCPKIYLQKNKDFIDKIASVIFDDLEPFIGQLTAIETWRFRADEIIDAWKER